jgi:hypothetical protein
VHEQREGEGSVGLQQSKERYSSTLGSRRLTQTPSCIFIDVDVNEWVAVNRKCSVSTKAVAFCRPFRAQSMC